MIRRNRQYRGLRLNDVVKFPPSRTSQDEPNLRDILVAYSRGQDVSQYFRVPAVKATAEQQFTNRIGKVDYLTEMSDYVRKEVDKANKLLEKEKTRVKLKKEDKPAEPPVESAPGTPPSSE